MRKRYIDKACLGSAQFGMDYGVANKNGRVSAAEAHKILQYAAETGIGLLDTAHAYGESEEVIGGFISKKGNPFKIISKISSSDGGIDSVEAVFRDSLRRLNVPALYGCLLHSMRDFLKREEAWDEVVRLKDRGMVDKIGFSVYRPQDLEVLFDRKVPFDIIQFPYSVFDRRFERHLDTLKSRNIEMHARSVFLQGLAFLDPYSLPEKLSKAKDHILCLGRFSRESGISVNALCLNFVLANGLVDAVIIGIDGLEQLRKNVADIAAMKEAAGPDILPEGISMDDEEILLPYRWN